MYGYYNIVRKLVDHKDILVDQGNAKGVTPLCAASSLGLIDIVWTLLQKADINRASLAGNPPLHHACVSPASAHN